MNEKPMKRKPVRTTAPDMRSEYDFSGAVRGKYYRRYRDTSNVVVIDADVHERFRNAAAVNEALRALIRAAGEDRGHRKRPARTRPR